MTIQHLKRISERLVCDIAVDACTTLENRPARIVDLSTHGAQVRCDETYEQGERIHLDYKGEFVWGTVAWSEVDRMGVKFVAPLSPTSLLGHQIVAAREIALREKIVQRSGGFGRRMLAA